MDYELKSDEPQNSIKISKNSRGYTWEIKKYFKEPQGSTNAIIEWLKAVDKKLKDEFEKEAQKPKE